MQRPSTSTYELIFSLSSIAKQEPTERLEQRTLLYLQQAIPCLEYLYATKHFALATYTSVHIDRDTAKSFVSLLACR